MLAWLQMHFTSSSGGIRVWISLSEWELLGKLRSGEPLFFDHEKKLVIARMEKFAQTSKTTTLDMEILAQHGELKSCLPAGPITLTSA